MLTFKPGGPTRPGGPDSPIPFSPCNTHCVITAASIRFNFRQINETHDKNSPYHLLDQEILLPPAWKNTLMGVKIRITDCG